MSIDLILIMVLLFITIAPIIGIVAYVINKKSYRNTVWIARQTGEEINDVIWIPDKFKVRNINGTWEIKFYHMKEKTPSIDGKLWTKFLPNDGKILRLTKDQFDTLDLRRHLKRGLFLYETTEGEFYPLTIRNDGKNVLFSIVNQDNRNFIMRETQDINNLTRNKKQEKLLLWAIIIGILGMVIVSGLIGYFQNKQHEENVQATVTLCGQYTTAIIEALTNPNSTKPQFANSIKPIISLPGG